MSTMLENFKIPLHFFYDSNKAGLYAVNGEFSSNACRQLMTSTIKNPQHEKKLEKRANDAETDKQTTKSQN